MLQEKKQMQSGKEDRDRNMMIHGQTMEDEAQNPPMEVGAVAYLRNHLQGRALLGPVTRPDPGVRVHHVYIRLISGAIYRIGPKRAFGRPAGDGRAHS